MEENNGVNNPFSLQNIANNAIKAERGEDMKVSKQLTLGEIILKLEAVNPKRKNGEDKTIIYDFAYFLPTHLMSWRGSYCELAIGYSDKEPGKTVNEFLKDLKEAIGKIYSGYKGGDYMMGKTTPIWVANYGESCETAIVNIKDGQYMVILETQYIEY